MKLSSVFVMAAAVMFMLAAIATNGEPDTPSNLGRAYFFLFIANFFFALL